MASIKAALGIALVLVPSLATAEEMVKVLPGETLMTFSNRVYGTHQKWRQILKWNQAIIKDPNRIEPGLELKVMDAGPKAEVAVRPAVPVKPAEPRHEVAKARTISSEGARVVYPASEKPAATAVAVEKPVTRPERREVEETEAVPERAEEHASPSESAHTPAGRAAIFPGIQHPDPDGEPLEPFSSLEVPK